MDFLTFCIRSVDTVELITQHPVIHVQGAQYPLSVWSWWVSRLKEKQPGRVISIDLEETDLSSAQGSLLSYGFGQTSFFWLRSYHHLSASSRKAWNAFIESYAGPHTIIFFSEDPLSTKRKDILSLTIPETITQKQFLSSAQSFSVSPRSIELFAQRLYEHTRVIPLEDAWSMIWYAFVVGKNCDQFFEEQKDLLTGPDRSLFMLSEYFFASKQKQFFGVWSELYEKYTVPFWLTFWSDQLWKAALVVSAYKAGDVARAKKYGHRLPFSFLKQDWQKYSFKKLVHAHEQIYQLDYRFKHGFEVMFEHFYLNFWHHVSK